MFKRCINFSLKTINRLFPSEKPLLFTGAGSTKQMATLLRASGYERPLLVTEKVLVELGLLDELLEHFKQLGCEVTIYDGIIPNPTYAVIDEGIEVCNENDCDSVFVVGGGSAIDAAKVIAACCSNAASIEKVIGFLKVDAPTLPFYVVPTTSGTGSEVTNVAVISETTTHRKKFVVDAKLIPAAAALDANMLKSLSPKFTAATGMDALTHAIESYTSVNRFSDAERDAKLAIKLLLEYLPIAYEDGDNVEARELVALGSFLAGYAFNKTGLGYVHAISHQISAHYNTAHGLANAVILPRVMRFNKSASANRFAQLERMLSESHSGTDDQAAERFIKRVEALGEQLDIPAGLDELQEKDFEAIVENALKEGFSFYAVPKLMRPTDCEEILAEIVEAAKAEAQEPLPTFPEDSAVMRQQVTVGV